MLMSKMHEAYKKIAQLANMESYVTDLDHLPFFFGGPPLSMSIVFKFMVDTYKFV